MEVAKAADSDAVSARPDQVPVVPFGPGSLMWELAGDVRGGVFGPYVAFLQGAHPVVAAGVFEHSSVWTNPYKRGVNSLLATLRWVYGGQKAYDEAQLLRDLHKDIKGQGFDGKRYHALNPEPYAWVWATGWVAYVGALRSFSSKQATRATEEQLYEEFKNLGRILGVRERLIPATLAEFEGYFDNMIEELAAAEEIIGDELIDKGLALFASPPPPPYVPNMLWRPIGRMYGRAFFFMAAAYGDERLRAHLQERIGLEWTPKRQRRARLLLTALDKGGSRLPEPLRYFPYAYLARRRARRTAPAGARG